MKTRHIYILTIISIFTIFSCTKEKSEGPSINELYGDFDGTASLLVSNKNPDFSNNEVTKFSCEFGKIVDWKISITGLVSNAKKIITGNSNILDSNINFWDGSASEFPFFIEENCALELTFLYQPDTLRDTVLIIGTQLYDDGYIVADFENGFPLDGLIKPQGNNTMPTFVIADDEPLLGNHYFQMGGKLNFDWALGKIDLKLDYSSSSISSQADDFYLNLGILSDTIDLDGNPIHNGQFLNILISESDAEFNSGGDVNVATIFDNDEEVYKLKIYIDWDGWKLISIRYSDFVATNSSSGVTFAKNPKDIKGMRIACQACPSSGASAQCEENFDRIVRTDFDHIIFTENRAFFDVITGFSGTDGNEWNKN
jgi:hypothetical protein